MYDYFSTFINITQIYLSTMYFDSTGGAAALLPNYAAAVSDTLQVPWRSLSSVLMFMLLWQINIVVVVVVV